MAIHNNQADAWWRRDGSPILLNELRLVPALGEIRKKWKSFGLPCLQNRTCELVQAAGRPRDCSQSAAERPGARWTSTCRTGARTCTFSPSRPHGWWTGADSDLVAEKRSFESRRDCCRPGWGGFDPSLTAEVQKRGVGLGIVLTWWGRRRDKICWRCGRAWAWATAVGGARSFVGRKLWATLAADCEPLADLLGMS